jgi:hypothetical protein
VTGGSPRFVEDGRPGIVATTELRGSKVFRRAQLMFCQRFSRRVCARMRIVFARFLWMMLWYFGALVYQRRYLCLRLYDRGFGTQARLGCGYSACFSRSGVM